MPLWLNTSYLWNQWMKFLFNVCLQINKDFMLNLLHFGEQGTHLQWHANINTHVCIYVGLETLPAELAEYDTCSSVELWSVAVGWVVVAATELGTLTGLLVASSCMFWPVIPLCWIKFRSPRASKSPERFLCVKVSLKSSSLRDI